MGNHYVFSEIERNMARGHVTRMLPMNVSTWKEMLCLI